jgi:hypothetical protein
MSPSVTRGTLDHLARSLEELAGDAPADPDTVDLVTLTDIIGVLGHHLQRALEQAQDRFTEPETVRTPERLALVHLTTAAADIAHALQPLTDALACATAGFQRQTRPKSTPSYLHNDAEVLWALTAEKCVATRDQLRHTAAALRTPATHAGMRVTGPRARPAATPRPRQPSHH